MKFGMVLEDLVIKLHTNFELKLTIGEGEIVTGSSASTFKLAAK